MDEYSDLARIDRKKMAPVVVGVLGMVPKDWKKSRKELEIRERIKSIQTIALL